MTGKHAGNDAPPQGGRFKLGAAGPMYQARYWRDRVFETVEARAPSPARQDEHDLPWPGCWPIPCTAPVIGAGSPAQLTDSQAAADAVMPAEMKGRLDEMTKAWRPVDTERWSGVCSGLLSVRYAADVTNFPERGRPERRFGKRSATFSKSLRPLNSQGPISSERYDHGCPAAGGFGGMVGPSP